MSKHWKNISRRLMTDISAVGLLIGFATYFEWGVLTLRQMYAHGDIYTYYYPFRQWFADVLRHGEFPLWNPYWGLGHPAEVWASIPLDLYSVLEIVVGPFYHFYLLAQLIALLVTGYCVCRRFGFGLICSLAGAIIFFVSPLVLIWSQSFLIMNVYIAHVLLFCFFWLWFVEGRRRFLFLIAATGFFSMLGTKIEFWFAQSCYFAFLAALLTILVPAVSRGARIWRASLSLLALGAGMAGNLWQVAILYPIIGLSGRIPAPSSDAFVLLIRDLVANTATSGLWQLLLAFWAFSCLASWLSFPSRDRRTQLMTFVVVAALLGMMVWYSYQLEGEVQAVAVLRRLSTSSTGAWSLAAVLLVFSLLRRRIEEIPRWVLCAVPVVYWTAPLL
jgi:hypothetical protein